MKITVYEVVFRVTDKYRNGMERIMTKSVYMLPFDKDTGKHLNPEMQIAKGTAVLKAEGYLNIEYMTTKSRNKLFAE